MASAAERLDMLASRHDDLSDRPTAVCWVERCGESVHLSRSGRYATHRHPAGYTCASSGRFPR